MSRHSNGKRLHGYRRRLYEDDGPLRAANNSGRTRAVHIGVYKIVGNDLHKTSKGLREMNYQNTQQFERATMRNNLLKPLLVLCGVSKSAFL